MVGSLEEGLTMPLPIAHQFHLFHRRAARRPGPAPFPSHRHRRPEPCLETTVQHSAPQVTLAYPGLWTQQWSSFGETNLASSSATLLQIITTPSAALDCFSTVELSGCG